MVDHIFMYLDKDPQVATLVFGKAVSQIPREKRSWIRLEEEIRGKNILNGIQLKNSLFF